MKIRGKTQIMPGTIYNDQIATDAGITLNKLENGDQILLAGGSVPMAADKDMGGHKIINVAPGELGTDAVNKGQMDAGDEGALASSTAYVDTALNTAKAYTDSKVSAHKLESPAHGVASILGAESTSGAQSKANAAKDAAIAAAATDASTKANAVAADLATHGNNFDNPHQVTLQQLGGVASNDVRLSDRRSPLAHEQDWSTITGKPTSILGYGIVDGETITGSQGKANAALDAAKLYSDGKLVQHKAESSAHAGSNITFTPSSGVVATNISAAILEVNAKKLGSTSNAASATKLETARTITVAGDISGETSFDGTADVSMSAELSPSGVVAGTYKSVTVDAKGRVLDGTNPSTLAGFGILDAYTKTQAGTTFAPISHIQNWNTIQNTPTTLSGYGIINAYTKEQSDAAFSPVGHGHAWSSLTGIPTTLLGYGITDAIKNLGNVPSVNSGLDANKPAPGILGRLYISIDTKCIYRDNGTSWDGIATISWANLTGKPTTISGYGIIDAYTKTQSDNKYATVVHGHAWGNISGTPTSLGGYGIQDAYTKAQADAKYAEITHTQDWSTITGKPNFADPSWKGIKANSGLLPLTGNTIGDTFIVVDDGDGKGAIYVCAATSGTFAQQWAKEGDVDFSNPAWDSIRNAPTTVAGYGITDVYTKTQADARFAALIHSQAWNTITSTPTTLAGYGITDSIKKYAGNATVGSGVDANKPVPGVADRIYIALDTNKVYRDDGSDWVLLTSKQWSDLLNKPTTIAGYGITDAFTRTESDALYAPISHNQAWNTLTATPTTLAGYGIADAYTKIQADSRYAAYNHTQAWGTITLTPSTLAGYGIVDSYTKAQADGLYSPLIHDQDWTSIKLTPTTLSGYGITDAYTKVQTDAKYSLLGHAQPWNTVTTTPTTIAGYGITDAYTKAQADARFYMGTNPIEWTQVINSPTTLAGYGITDTYSKTDSDSRFAPTNHNQAWNTLTDTPTTLAGYGITDAYSTAGAEGAFAPIDHTQAWTTLTGTPTTLAGYGITDVYSKTASDARFLGIAANAPSASKLAVSRAISLSGAASGTADFDGSSNISINVTIPWVGLSDKPTTVSGYGIADVYTKDASDARYLAINGAAASVTWDNITGKPNFADPSWKGVKINKAALPLTGNAIGDTYVVADDGDGRGAFYECKATAGTVDEQFDKMGDVDWASPLWASIQNKPTTLAGYGITDSFTQALADTLYVHQAEFSTDWASITNTPTTLSGFGITNAYTKTEVDNNFLGINAKAASATVADTATTATTATTAGTATTANAVPWTGVSSKPTTISGFSITDAYTKTEVDSLLSGYSPSVSWASVTSKPTTLSGFGITDVYNKTEGDARYLVSSGGWIGGDINNLGTMMVHAYNAANTPNSDLTARFSILSRMMNTSGSNYEGMQLAACDTGSGSTNTGDIFTRTVHNTTWTPWKRMATADELVNKVSSPEAGYKLVIQQGYGGSWTNKSLLVDLDYKELKWFDGEMFRTIGPDVSNFLEKPVSGFRMTYGTTAPATPVDGQELWIDTTNKVLKIYEGTSWVTLGSGYSL